MERRAQCSIALAVAVLAGCGRLGYDTHADGGPTDADEPDAEDAFDARVSDAEVDGALDGSDASDAADAMDAAEDADAGPPPCHIERARYVGGNGFEFLWSFDVLPDGTSFAAVTTAGGGTCTGGDSCVFAFDSAGDTASETPIDGLNAVSIAARSTGTFLRWSGDSSIAHVVLHEPATDMASDVATVQFGPGARHGWLGAPLTRIDATDYIVSASWGGDTLTAFDQPAIADGPLGSGYVARATTSNEEEWHRTFDGPGDDRPLVLGVANDGSVAMIVLSTMGGLCDGATCTTSSDEYLFLLLDPDGSTRRVEVVTSANLALAPDGRLFDLLTDRVEVRDADGERVGTLTVPGAFAAGFSRDGAYVALTGLAHETFEFDGTRFTIDDPRSYVILATREGDLVWAQVFEPPIFGSPWVKVVDGPRVLLATSQVSTFTDCRDPEVPLVSDDTSDVLLLILE